MIKSIVKLVALSFCLPTILIGQDNFLEIKGENKIESVRTLSDDFPVYGGFFPYDINTISFGDLISIPYVSTEFASSIVNYRKKIGQIDSFDGLALLKGATDDALASLKRTCFVKKRDMFSFEYSSYVGYSPVLKGLYANAFDDPGIKTFQKIRGIYNNVDFFFISDKDMGERNYFDFYSVSLSVRDIFKFSKVVIGDFLINFGSKLLFSWPARFSKGSDPTNSIFNENREILLSYHSRDESGMMRGVSVVYSLKAFDLFAFVSRKGLDAYIDSVGAVTSVNYTGLHQGSNFSKHNLSEVVAGGGLQFTSQDVDFGILAASFGYNHFFKNYYSQNGFATSSFVRIFKNNLYAESELVVENGVSYVANVKLDYDRAAFAAGVRGLRMTMLPLYSGIMSETFPLLPENGVYLGTKLKPNDGVELGFYYDLFYVKSLGNLPERNGEEIFLDCLASVPEEIISGATVYFRYRYKSTENFYIPQYLGYPVTLSTVPNSRQSFRFEFHKKFNAWVKIKSRYEKNILGGGEIGELFVFQCKVGSRVVALSQEIAACRTGSYNSAFYFFEEDIVNSSPLVVLYGDEIRLSLLVTAEPMRNFKVMLKFGKDSFSSSRKFTVGNISSYFTNNVQISAGITYLFKN